MKRNSKLSLALHALGHMAAEPDRPITSEQIGQHFATNAVVVRRVLGLLREAGIVSSEKGHAGGWRLAKAPEDITVASVYVAIREPLMNRPDAGEDLPSHCAIERTLHETMNAAAVEAEAFLIDRLSAHTIRDLAAAMSVAPTITVPPQQGR